MDQKDQKDEDKVDLAKLTEYIKDGAEAVKLAQGRTIVAMLGFSGHGKTATSHYLHGSKFQRVDPTPGGFSLFGGDNGLLELTMVENRGNGSISSGPASATLYPNLSRLEFVERHGFFLTDFAGFGDNRKDIHERIATSLVPQILINNCQKIDAILICIPLDTFRDTRLTTLQELAQRLSSMTSNLANILPSVICIITKLPINLLGQEDNVVSHLQVNLTEALREEAKLNKDLVMFLKHLNASPTNIIPINLLDQEGKCREKIMRKITEVSSSHEIKEKIQFMSQVTKDLAQVEKLLQKDAIEGKKMVDEVVNLNKAAKDIQEKVRKTKKLWEKLKRSQLPRKIKELESTIETKEKALSEVKSKTALEIVGRLSEKKVHSGWAMFGKTVAVAAVGAAGVAAAPIVAGAAMAGGVATAGGAAAAVAAAEVGAGAVAVGAGAGGLGASLYKKFADHKTIEYEGFQKWTQRRLKIYEAKLGKDIRVKEPEQWERKEAKVLNTEDVSKKHETTANDKQVNDWISEEVYDKKACRYKATFTPPLTCDCYIEVLFEIPYNKTEEAQQKIRELGEDLTKLKEKLEGKKQKQLELEAQKLNIKGELSKDEKEFRNIETKLLAMRLEVKKNESRFEVIKLIGQVMRDEKVQLLVNALNDEAVKQALKIPEAEDIPQDSDENSDENSDEE